MTESKLSRVLQEQLARAEGEELIEIVLELRPLPVPPDDGGSRSERIAIARDAFQRLAAPVRTAIQAADGEVLADVWINQTLLARVPAERVAGLARLDEVRVLDVPRRLELASH